MLDLHGLNTDLGCTASSWSMWPTGIKILIIIIYNPYEPLNTMKPRSF